MRPELLEATKLLQSSRPEEIGEAIRLLQNTVYSFSMKVCGHREDAEDNMQEVFVRALPHLAKLKDPQALSVWLYTVTRNRCWRMRRKSVHAPKETLSLDELMPDPSELGLLLTDAGRSPEENLLSGEQDQLVQQAVLEIPPQYRIILVLHDMEDLDTEQIAKILDIKPGTVRVRLHRARLAVRKEMNRLSKRENSREEKPKRQAESLPRPKNCRDLFADLSEYLDGRVEPKTCDQMRRHIEACPACVAFLQDLKHAVERCRKVEVQCDPSMTARLSSLLAQEYLRFLAASSR